MGAGRRGRLEGCVPGDSERNVAPANRTGFVYPREENIVTICREIR